MDKAPSIKNNSAKKIKINTGGNYFIAAHTALSVRKLWELLFFPKWQLIADLNKRSSGQQGDGREAQGGNKQKMHQGSKGLRPQATPQLHTLISSIDCRERRPPSIISATSPYSPSEQKKMCPRLRHLL